MRIIKRFRDSVDLPIVIYNVPGRCGTEIAVEYTDLRRLAELPRIAGLKRRDGGYVPHHADPRG